MSKDALTHAMFVIVPLLFGVTIFFGAWGIISALQEAAS